METTMSDRVSQLILRCDDCGEAKILNTDHSEQGHSWASANCIADEFDVIHDACERERGIPGA